VLGPDDGSGLPEHPGVEVTVTPVLPQTVGSKDVGRSHANKSSQLQDPHCHLVSEDQSSHSPELSSGTLTPMMKCRKQRLRHKRAGQEGGELRLREPGQGGGERLALNPQEHLRGEAKDMRGSCSPTAPTTCWFGVRHRCSPKNTPHLHISILLAPLPGR
jgi:hypothetical protein